MTKLEINNRDRFILKILEEYTDKELYILQKNVMLEIIRREGKKHRVKK